VRPSYFWVVPEMVQRLTSGKYSSPDQTSSRREPEEVRILSEDYAVHVCGKREIGRRDRPVEAKHGDVGLLDGHCQARKLHRYGFPAHEHLHRYA
jgi:hypothetical protein